MDDKSSFDGKPNSLNVELNAAGRYREPAKARLERGMGEWSDRMGR